MNKQRDTKYLSLLSGLKEKIRTARLQVSFKVNAELLRLYWEIGNTVLEQQKKEGWGTKVIARLAADLRIEFPDMKGLSERNLVYMQTFASAYPDFLITQVPLAQLTTGGKNLKSAGKAITQVLHAKLEHNDAKQRLLSQLTWYHHITLLDKIKDESVRFFYIEETIKNGWSRDVMVHQIESGLHQRRGKIASNFKDTIAPEQSELVQQIFKDPYKFEFIYLGQEARERDLEDALVHQLTKFLLELGQHFAFMGKQYKMLLGEKEYFFDLLFYHTRLKRYIVIDLKIDEFKPEYKGKMEFYLNLADDHLKQHDDEKSIGLILCKTKDGLVVEYALRESNKPIGIAEYALSDRLPKELKGELPTVEELEAEIEKGMEELKKPIERKYERLKKLISGMKQPRVKEELNLETSERIFTKVVLPLRDEITKALAKIAKEFSSTEKMIWMGSSGYKTDNEAQAQLKSHVFSEFRVEIRLLGFKRAGTKAFDIWKDIGITTNRYNYTIGLIRHQPENILLNKLYHELLEKKELKIVAEQFIENVLDDITQHVERIQKEK